MLALQVWLWYNFYSIKVSLKLTNSSLKNTGLAPSRKREKPALQTTYLDTVNRTTYKGEDTRAGSMYAKTKG